MIQIYPVIIIGVYCLCLEAVAGKTGASIILIAGLLIEAVILFGLSFSRILTKTGEAVNRTAVRVNKSFSRADHPSQRPINSRGFDHVVDAALRRRQAGLDIDGVDRRYDRRRQPTAQPTRGGEITPVGDKIASDSS